MSNKEEAKRLLTDWWGECRTCKHWSGKRGSQISAIHRDLVGTCYSDKGPFYLQHTQRAGNCVEWDAYNTDIALEVMEEGER